MTIFTALITPFNLEGCLDEPGLAHLLDRQQQAGVDGIVLLGTTAETPTLTEEEKKRILSIASQYDLLLIVGCGTYCTRTTLENIEQAAACGAHAVLIVAPYYNRPPPKGLMAHFLYLADKSPCPLYLYNHPGRTQVLLTPSMIVELAGHPNIIGIKEVTPHLVETIWTLKKAHPTFQIFAGDDPLGLTTVANGGTGLISVASNLFPEKMKQLMTAPLPEAQKIQAELWPLFQALSTNNPIPIKAAMQLIGLPAGSPRLPLVPLEERECERLGELLVCALPC